MAQPCCFGNSVGLLCTVLGAILERQSQHDAVSQFMLKQGKSYMKSVLVRVEAERPDNKDWATVHLSILVNQALGELVGTKWNHAESSEGSVCSENTHLRATESYIKLYSQFFKFEDLMEFYFSLQPLMSKCPCAQAA